MAEVTPVPVTPVTNQDAVNEQVIGKAKESIATAPVEEAPIVPIAKRKIKWGDKEREVTLEEAAQLAEKAWGIEEKAKVAAKQASDAQGLLDMLQKNPREFAKRCKAMGLDPQKMATDILYEQIELNTLTPEQRELRELKAQQAEAEALKKEQEESIKQSEMNKQTQDWAIKFESELMEACKTAQIPMSRLTIALAAQYIDAGLAAKKELTVKDVLPFVKRDIQNIHKQTMGSLEGDALLEYLGEDLSNKVAAARVARYKKGAVVETPKNKVSEPTTPNRLKGLKGRAYFRELTKMKSEQGIGAFPGQE